MSDYERARMHYYWSGDFDADVDFDPDRYLNPGDFSVEELS